MMGTDPQKLSADDALWNEMRTEFSEAELTDLTYCVAMWIGSWTHDACTGSRLRLRG
jgi:hypothetical protein